MTFNKKTQISISIIIFGAITLLLVIFVICPLFKEIKQNSEDFVFTKKELNSLEVQTKNLEEFREFYQKNQSNLDKVSELFINSEVPIDFVNFLEKTAQDSKISIKISLLSQTLQKETEKEQWPSLQFQISVSGSFSNVSKFLEKAENAPYLIEIRNLSINRLTEDELKSKELEGFSLGDIKATLLGKVYTQKKD